MHRIKQMDKRAVKIIQASCANEHWGVQKVEIDGVLHSDLDGKNYDMHEIVNCVDKSNLVIEVDGNSVRVYKNGQIVNRMEFEFDARGLPYNKIPNHRVLVPSPKQSENGIMLGKFVAENLKEKLRSKNLLKPLASIAANCIGYLRRATLGNNPSPRLATLRT